MTIANERSAVTSTDYADTHDVPDPDVPSFPEVEFDQNVAPRPEEEIADVARAIPDIEDHGQAT